VTKIVVHFRLEKPLTEPMLAAIREAHTIYGIARISLSKAMDNLTVEYDATRLRPAEVESRLRMYGLPVVPA
jgi:allophanate hydrolase subunit 1